MASRFRRARPALAAVLLGLLTVAGQIAVATGVAGPAAASTTAIADVYVLHGLAGIQADIAVDAQVVKSGAPASTVVGPIKVSAGQHTITVHPTDGSADITAMVDAAAGSSVDVVAHAQADPTEAPVLTVFPNDLSPVASDKARLVVAHTAAVPPADIRVNGSVLFSNVANGEALTVLVPGGSYRVDVVPTATDGPVVFGPVDLAVKPGALNRVFAFGNPEDGTMNAIVQVLDLTTSGSGPPGSVNTGNGGQASTPAESSSSTRLPLMFALGLGITGAAVAVRRRGARRVGAGRQEA